MIYEFGYKDIKNRVEAKMNFQIGYKSYFLGLIAN